MRNGEKEIPGGRWPHVLGWTHRNRVPLTRENKRLLSWRAISKAVVAGESWWSGSRSCPALTVRGRFHGPPGRKDSACRLAERRLLVNSARREPRRLGAHGVCFAMSELPAAAPYTVPRRFGTIPE